MNDTDKRLKQCGRRAKKRHCAIVTEQVSASIMMATPLTLMELIILRDLACDNRDAWELECQSLTQQIADFEPPLMP